MKRAALVALGARVRGQVEVGLRSGTGIVGNAAKIA